LPKVISFDEMWSYAGARRRGKRRECWVWTAVVKEPDGRRWVDFEVGDRSKNTFLRLYGRLPKAERDRTDAYRVSTGCLPADVQALPWEL
jgi:IS1 family transposase